MRKGKCVGLVIIRLLGLTGAAVVMAVVLVASSACSSGCSLILCVVFSSEWHHPKLLWSADNTAKSVLLPKIYYWPFWEYVVWVYFEKYCHYIVKLVDMFQIYDIIFPINSCTETAKEIDRRPVANHDDKTSPKRPISQHDVVTDNQRYYDRYPQPRKEQNYIEFI
ncbi:hypothetical protein FF38_09773 [Lucilia cuprina]|uniref:Uncharacterized protein n=1 Tax=Lucilia cuprina TaxID=7375 RepID=A0A0L0BR27_LUCCU|nr:hypothetical protein FF38_09773 [Lucilia cuprina]